MTAAAGLEYNVQDNIVQRFYNLARIATAQDNGYVYEKNTGEEIADAMLWHVETLPYELKNILLDPRVVTIALSALAILVTSLVFYPFLTISYIKTAATIIPFPPLWSIRLTAYLLSIETILGYTLRAESRFFNENLLKIIPGYIPKKDEEKWFFQ